MHFLTHRNSSVNNLMFFSRTVLALLFFVSLGSSEIFAQPTYLEKGKVLDSIAVSDSDETYALYLPKQYDPAKLSAIVFIFDPSGSGKGGLQPFLKASEKFNYVLVCSNQTRNGLFDKNFEIINRLFTEVFGSFNIDEKQIYTAGFSGGSRLATAVAVLSGQIQGVVACGAGFSPNTTHTPGPGTTFSYVGLVGNEDMNYQEMRKSQGWLDTFGIQNELFTNNDNHKWPPDTQVLKAFGWLELQAYARNIRPKNNSFIESSYREMCEEARDLEASGQMDLAVRNYEQVVRNYARYFKVDSILFRNTILKTSQKYLSELKIETVIRDTELDVRKKFVERFAREIEQKNPPNNYKWWSKELKKLDQKYITSKDSAFSKLGKRVGYAVYAMAIETGNSKRRDGEFKKAIYAHQLVTVVLPEQPWPYYLLAIDYAMIDDKQKTLDNLKMAIAKGWSSKKAILGVEAFQKYKEDSQFMSLLEELK